MRERRFRDFPEWNMDGKIEKAFSEDRQASENAFCVGNAAEPGGARALVTAYNPGNYLCVRPAILEKPGKVRPRGDER